MGRIYQKGTITMGFLDELISSAKVMVDKAGKQTDKVVEVSKLKYQSIQLQNEVNHLYEQLGVAVYAKMVEECNNGDLIASLADEITEVRAALKVVEDKISEQKNEQFCPKCGAKSSRDAVFCANCGAKLKEDAPAEEPAAEEPAAEEAPAEEKECCTEAPAEEPACCCEEAPSEEEQKPEAETPAE